MEDSSSSNTSLSSDYMEDTSSSSTSSSSNGPLYHLSHLMDQLPIKRGLSKYYEGKSQSFASLASVQSLESLAKAENPYKKKIKYCKSFCGGLDCQKVLSPKANILKKGSSGLKRNCSNNFMATTSRLHHVPLQKHF